MQRADQSLTAGSTVYVTCLTWGSRPAAKIRWFLRDKPLLDVKEVVFEGNSTTKSTVRLVLSALDNGAHLRCIAENPNAPLSTTANGLTSIWSSITPPGDDSTSTSTTADRHHQRHHQQQQQQQAVITTKMAAFDQITLLVKFLPNVTIEAVDADLHQQTNQRAKFPTTIYSVKEGDKLTLNCKIDSNPEPFKIRWLQNRKEIFPSVQKGAPRCALPPLTTIESSLQYPANLFCQVDANPMENVAIYWQTPTNILLSKDGKIIRVKSTNNAPAEDDQQKLQNSLDEFDPDNEYEVDEEGGNHGPSGGKRRLNRLLIASKGVRSRLTIVPQAITDFGIYRCWAENAIGSNQNEPCRFNLTSQATAGSLSPRPVHHCLTNYTADGYLSIRCLHSALNATASAIAKSSLLSAYSSLAEKHLQFHLEMHQISGLDGSLLALIANQTNPLEPIFLVQSLQPHAVYQINVYASNPYGVSDKVTMLFQTSNPTASNMTVSSSLVFSSSSSSSSTSSAKPTTSPIDDWLLGGAALPVGYDDESTHVSGNISEDEDVSGSELNFDLERSDDGTASGNDRWSISKPDLQKQNRLSDAAGGDVGASHRVLVILVTVLAASFIVFSILVAIAIGLCVYRNRRDKSRGNSGNQTSSSNQSNSESTSKPSTPKVAPSPNSSPVAKICTYSNHHHHATLSTPDIIPCDGVLIFNPSSDISTSSANNFPSTVAAVAYGPNSGGTGGGAIYRDFVSLDSDSSYANYTASDASGCQQGQGAAGMTLHTLDPVSIAAEPAVEPKFLCQPNHVSILNDLNSTGFISGQGNVQLVTTGPTYSIEGASNGGQSFAASPFHLVNGPFLSIQPAAPNGQLGHQQHGRHNAAQFNQSQLLFMGKANQLVEDGHSSGQSQINSSFSLSESPSELTYHNSAHLSTFQQQQSTDGGGKTATATANGGASTTTTVTTTEDGEIIQATTV